MRYSKFVLPCVVLVLLAFAFRGLPAVEPAGAATLPSEKGGVPAVGPTEVKPAASEKPAAAEKSGASERPAAAAKPGEAEKPGTAEKIVSPGKGLVITGCRVELFQSVDVPGIEAGVLIALEAKPGMDVRSGMTLGHVDDREPQMQKIIGQLKHDAAKAKAESDVDVVYAREAWEAAHFEYMKDLDVIKVNARGITAVDLMRAKIADIKAKAGWDKAKLDQRQLEFEAETKKAEVEAADLSIERRQIRAPFNGVVTNVYRHPGEWVAPGDPVIKVIQVDRLRIEGTVSASEYDPPELDGRPVNIETEMAHGRKVNFTGKVVFVSPLVSLAGEYVVHAEVNNKQENGLWVLSPGLPATMTIQLK